MEHFHKTIDGWFSYESFYKAIAEQIKPGFHIVEVGAWKGMSTVFLAVEIINSGKEVKFDCVDTWRGSEEHVDKSSPFYEPLLETSDGLYNHFLKNIEPVKNMVNVIRLPSVEAAKLYEDGSLDLVYIDAAHDYDNVVADIKAWLPKVRKGGTLSGHDYYHPPVNKAVHDTLNNVKYFGEDVWVYKV